MKEDELWPPKWPVWAYHDFQYEPTFNVAQIDIGNSLEEFIENSQNYQAKLLKYAIENYRKNKYSKVTGIFQFMFVDNWNAITWSVVDYFRRPKKGYNVLKTVYQPVLIGMDLEREKISLNEIISFSNIWIVNDTLDKYENASAVVSLFRDKKIVTEKRLETGCISSDAVKHFSNPHLSEGLRNLNLKEKGKYVIKIELIDNADNVISKNSYKIEVI